MIAFKTMLGVTRPGFDFFQLHFVPSKEGSDGTRGRKVVHSEERS